MVLPKNGSNITIELDESEPGTRYVSIAFNAIKYCGCILERIFEEQIYNSCGLYLLKIFQQSNWKTIILDDYVPLKAKKSEIESKIKEVPAFIHVKVGS